MTSAAPQRSRLVATTGPTPGNKARRAIWTLVWAVAGRPSPVPLHGWRRLLLRLFGARIEAGAHIYPSARIWAPWNLAMGPASCLAAGVNCYNVAAVRLGRNALASQGAYLCTASHDYDDPAFPLVAAPIIMEQDSWVTTEAFIAPGVTIGEGGVVLARSVVTRDVSAWSVVGGNPARPLRARERPETGERDV